MLLVITKSNRKVFQFSLRFCSKSARKANKVDNQDKKKYNSHINYREGVFKDKPYNRPVVPPKDIIPYNSPYEKILTLIPKTSTNAVDFSLRQFEKNPLEGASVILSGLRSCHWFSKGRQFIDEHYSNMNGLSIAEGARLLAMTKNCNEDEAEDSERAEKMMKRLENVMIPPNMRQTIKLILLSLCDSQGFTKEINNYLDDGARYPLLYRQETYTIFSCHLLRNNEVDLLIKLLPYSPDGDITNNASTITSLCNSPEVAYWLLNLLKKDDKINKKKLTDWYFRALLNHKGPVICYDFLNLVVPIMRAAGVSMVPTKALPDGRLMPQNKFHIDMRESSIDFQDFRSEIAEMMKREAKRGAVVSEQDYEILNRAVEAWKRRAVEGKAIVVDTLNASLSIRKAQSSSTFGSFMEKLIEEYPNVLLVTRSYQVAWLKSLNLPGNTYIYHCERNSEDDVPVIAASLMYGNDCFALSNDRFAAHVHKFSRQGLSLFKEWIQHRVIRFDPINGKILVPSVANNKLQNLSTNIVSPEALFIPVLADTSFWSYYSHWIAQQKK